MKLKEHKKIDFSSGKNTMYTTLQLAKKYISYYVTANNSKGHGVHSPFVFNFIKKVLRDKKKYECYEKIEKRRKELLEDKTVIEVQDFGAGSSVIKTKKRVVRDIAASSLKPKKYAQLLFRIVQYYRPNNVLELGTSFGITTAYLASGRIDIATITGEGAASIAAIAATTFEKLQLDNIELVQGNFTKTLPQMLEKIKQPGLAFVDGNHRKEPTLQYFQSLLDKALPNTIIIFDDIHWSKEMEEAWQEIQQHPQVTLTIDLFFIGLVFVNPDFKVKQHFTIRY